MTDKKDPDKDTPKDNTSNEDSKTTHDPSRRRFIKNTGMVAGGVVGGSLLGGVLTNKFTTKPETQTKNENAAKFQEARQFFSRFEDFVVLQAATERIFPKDENGPGAIELGVPYFIDKQLAGRWGINARDYRDRPFSGRTKGKVNNSNAQIDQLMLNRGDIFIQGLRKLNQESQDRFKTSFDKAEEDQQIEILKDFDDDKVKMNGVSSRNFFILLRQSTLEGAYADPLYGGNKDMKGWRMKEFPGPQASYANVIDDKDFVKMEPISLNDYQQH